MKKLFMEILYELLAWLVLIFGSIVRLLNWLSQSVIDIYNQKQLIKKRIRGEAIAEYERLSEEDDE